MKKKILTILLCGIIILGITGCGEADLEEAKQELEDTYEKYGWVDKEKVSTMIAKYNTEIMDSGLNTPAYDDYMTLEDNVYWFGLTENISYYLQPVKFSGDKEKDIVEMSALYFKKDTYDESVADKYAKLLIKANNENITDSEIDSLIKDAREKSSSKKTANNGKGISVGYLEYSDNYVYQVVRLYKD